MKMISLINLLRKQPFMRKFVRRRKNNNGFMWLSLISIGVGALLMGVRRGQNNTTIARVQNLVKNFTSKRGTLNLNDADLTEFSDELLASALGKKGNKGQS